MEIVISEIIYEASTDDTDKKAGVEIYLKRYESLDVPLGATVDISEGAIFNRLY